MNAMLEIFILTTGTFKVCWEQSFNFDENFIIITYNFFL